MIKCKVTGLLPVVVFALLGGCAVNPDQMPIYKFNSDVVSNGPSNSIITSVASKETLQKLNLPVENFMLNENTIPPDSLDGRPTRNFVRKFSGIPVDSNFQVEVSSGIKKMGINYYSNDTEINEYIVEFLTEPGHTYFTKFLINRSKTDRKKRVVTPIIYDVTNNLRLEGKFISNETVGAAR